MVDTLLHATQVALAMQIDFTFNNLARLTDAVLNLIYNPPLFSQIKLELLKATLEEKITCLWEALERKQTVSVQYRNEPATTTIGSTKGETVVRTDEIG